MVAGDRVGLGDDRQSGLQREGEGDDSGEVGRRIVEQILDIGNRRRQNRAGKVDAIAIVRRGRGSSRIGADAIVGKSVAVPTRVDAVASAVADDQIADRRTLAAIGVVDRRRGRVRAGRIQLEAIETARAVDGGRVDVDAPADGCRIGSIDADLGADRRQVGSQGDCLDRRGEGDHVRAGLLVGLLDRGAQGAGAGGGLAQGIIARRRRIVVRITGRIVDDEVQGLCGLCQRECTDNCEDHEANQGHGCSPGKPDWMGSTVSPGVHHYS